MRKDFFNEKNRKHNLQPTSIYNRQAAQIHKPGPFACRIETPKIFCNGKAL